MIAGAAGDIRIRGYNRRVIHLALGNNLIRPRVFVTASFASLALLARDARAADLPALPPAPAEPASCFASVYDFLIADPDDCPLAWRGIRLYGRLDYGAGYEFARRPFQRQLPQWG